MRVLTAVLLGLLLGLVSEIARVDTVALAEGPTCVYVLDTGHNLHGAFLKTFLARKGVENLGAPQTEAFMENGLVVQYFAGGRLELHPGNPEAFQVLLGLLGREYYGKAAEDPPVPSRAIPPPNHPNFRYFPESGQIITFAIKEFFDQRGGIDVFGYPISGLRYEEGKFVQYFQRMRVEWDLSGSGAIRTAPIGQLYLDKYHPNSAQRARAANDWCHEYSLNALSALPVSPQTPYVLPTPVPPTMVMALQVRVRFRQTGPTGPQYVDVSVYDQDGRPVAGAALYAIVYMANGNRVFPLMPSDKAGKSSLSFEIGNQPIASTTLVEVFAQVGPLTAVGRDMFTR